MNKINFKVLISIFLISFIFMSCGADDENDVTKTNHFLYETKEYILSQGVFVSYGESDQTDVYEVDLALFSSGLTYSPTGEELVGKGDIILFELYSSSESDLSGTYTFDSNDIGNSNTFIGGGIALNYDSNGDEDVPEGQDIGGGTVEVKKLGELYEISFDCTLFNGKKVTGYYKGAVN